MIGGIISYQGKETEISDVFNLGKIIGNDNTKNLIIGGIIGSCNSNINIDITNSYNTGKLETENNITTHIGSIAGDLKQMKLNNCYYLKGTYNVEVGESGSSTGITELDDISDFPSVLEVVNGEGVFKEDVNNINNGYPILEWQ